MYVAVAVFGFCLGPLGGVSRLAFADIIPPGHEAEFFALMEISDKGSSWMGPTFVTALWTAFPAHSRLAFVYLLLSCTVALAIMSTIDVKIALRDASSLKMAMRMRKLKQKSESAGIVRAGARGGAQRRTRVRQNHQLFLARLLCLQVSCFASHAMQGDTYSAHSISCDFSSVV